MPTTPASSTAMTRASTPKIRRGRRQPRRRGAPGSPVPARSGRERGRSRHTTASPAAAARVSRVPRPVAGAGPVATPGAVTASGTRGAGRTVAATGTAARRAQRRLVGPAAWWRADALPPGALPPAALPPAALPPVALRSLTRPGAVLARPVLTARILRCGDADGLVGAGRAAVNRVRILGCRSVAEPVVREIAHRSPPIAIRCPHRLYLQDGLTCQIGGTRVG